MERANPTSFYLITGLRRVFSSRFSILAGLQIETQFDAAESCQDNHRQSRERKETGTKQTRSD